MRQRASGWAGVGHAEARRTSFSASRDGSLKDVERRRPYQPPVHRSGPSRPVPGCHAAPMPPGPAQPSEAAATPLPESMRATVITRHGGPDVIEMRNVPVPRPGPTRCWCASAPRAATTPTSGPARAPTARRRPGPEAGWLGPLDFPRIQGGDVAGTVVAAGGATTGLVGARVLVDPANYEDPGPDARPVDVLGSERDGGFAEYVVVPADRVHRVDESPLSDVELAALPIAYGTALGMLERGSVADGHTVLVTGASGGVGLAVVQLAHARGARVVAVCSGDKAGAVRGAGADASWTAARGVVADAAAAPRGVRRRRRRRRGPRSVPASTCCAAGGRWVVAGASTAGPWILDVRRLYLANLALVGSTMHTPRIFALVDLARQGPSGRPSPRRSTWARPRGPGNSRTSARGQARRRSLTARRDRPGSLRRSPWPSCRSSGPRRRARRRRGRPGRAR